MLAGHVRGAWPVRYKSPAAKSRRGGGTGEQVIVIHARRSGNEQ
jgi:hypothetical protein